MNDRRLSKVPDPSGSPAKAVLPGRLFGRTVLVLVYERLWPVAVLAASCVAVFLVVSWLGLWLILPAWAHAAGLAVFAAALVAAIATAFRVRWPDRAQVLARLDRDTGLPHRPISATEDQLANGGDDPSTRALWEIHRRRLQAALAQARVAAPSPRLADRDRYALRAAVAVALVAAAFVAGPEKYGRVAAAFSWSAATTSPGVRIDAWIDPPGYTGKPPLVLLGQNRSNQGQRPDEISAPVGSSVVVRAAGTDAIEIAGTGALRPAADAKAQRNPDKTLVDRHFILAGDGQLRITLGGAKPEVFRLRALPDLPPRIRLAGPPTANARGSFELAYTIADDYGVTGAEARFGNPVLHGHAVTGRALVEPPRGILALPAMPGGLGDGKTTLDLSDHPWAGAQVTMTLSARDEGGNVGESAPTTMTLPAKIFNNPLARALVEQRRDLVLDPDHRAHVADSLDALQVAPDAFDIPPGVYLGLQSAQLQLAEAKTDADLLGVADYLWRMALRLENGDLDKTEQDLRDAQKALHDALDRGAPPDEIKRLTEALREQMNKFIAEMMKNAEENQADNDRSPDQNSQTVTEKDFKSMMDKMEEAARRGDTAEAQRLLDQLSSIMENLKTAKRGQGQDQATRDMNRSMSELNRMMQEQGDVRDKTFQRDRQGSDQQDGQQEGSDDQAGADNDPNGSDGQQPGQPQQGQGSGKPGQSGKATPGFDELRRRQGSLGGQLDALQRKLRGLGMKGEQGLSDAQSAMNDAERALGQGNGQGAVEAQGRALEGLQKGASGLQQQMAEQGGQDGQQAQGQGGNQDGENRDQGEDLDPLGRPRQGRGPSQGRDLDVSGGLAARAQQVLQELRRRLGDPTRSTDEQNYLERLLQRY